MNKFTLTSFLFISLIFISLTSNPGDGVTKLGIFSYKVTSQAKMQESDKQEILNIIKSTYGIRDIGSAREIMLKPVPLNGKKGKNPNWIVDKKIGPRFIDEKAIHYDNKPETPTPDSPKEPESPTTNASFNKINTILTKYGG